MHSRDHLCFRLRNIPSAIYDKVRRETEFIHHADVRHSSR